MLSALLLALAQSELAALVDWYELEGGRHVLVTYGPTGGLRLFDFERPSFDTLVEEDERWRWKKQAGGEAELAFERDASGAITGFTWKAGDEAGHAERNASYGYEQHEVQMHAGAGVDLCALVMLPRSEGRHPAAVIIQGSGDSDRDNVWAFSIAHQLAIHGTVVLLPDKRGCGKSKGDWKTVGFEELAKDALAGVRELQTVWCDAIDPLRIGLVGLSQGGWIAPLAASQSESVKFVVSVSAAAVPVGTQVRHELEQALRKGGADEQTLDIANELMDRAFAFGKTGEGWEDFLAGIEAAPPALAGAFPTERDDWRWGWYARVVDFDPVPLWGALAAPCLVVYGEADEHDNVPVAASVANLERLRAAGKENLDVRVYAGSGHALDAPDGNWIRRDFLEGLARWIQSR
jgi:pimeloyl-ACP methyl ester carboxylesterase